MKEHLPVYPGWTVIQSGLLTLCLQASLLAHSRTSDRPRSLSVLSTAQLLGLLSPAPWGLHQELELDWTAKVSNRHVRLIHFRKTTVGIVI